MTIEQLSAGIPVLSLLILLPLLAAGALYWVTNATAARRLTLGSMGLSLLLSLWVLLSFETGTSAVQFAEQVPWIPAMGIDYRLGVDGLSVLFIPLTALVFLAIQLGASDPRLLSRGFCANLLVLQAATVGIYSALDLVLFFCFFEFALIPSFWLIRLWGVGASRQAAASRYLIYMLVGSLPLLLGFILLGVNRATVTGAGLSFNWAALVAVPVPMEWQIGVFALMAIGFAIKGPALPFHTWVPATAMEGPTGMGAYLLGLKVGLYGFLRFVLPLTPEASQMAAPWLAGIGLAAIVYAGAIALVQSNFRRLLVFSSISHVGLILVAAFSMNASALQGALLLMVNAGIATAGLFICAGFLQRRLGSTDLRAMGGLVHRAPQMAAFCFIAGLALIGVPGTSGFVGEIKALSGAYAAQPVYGLIAVLGVVLSAGYFMWFFQRGFLGPVQRPAVAQMTDLDASERGVAVLMLTLVFAVGLAPGVLTSRAATSTEALVAHLEQAQTRLAQRAEARRLTAERHRTDPNALVLSQLGEGRDE